MEYKGDSSTMEYEGGSATMCVAWRVLAVKVRTRARKKCSSSERFLWKETRGLRRFVCMKGIAGWEIIHTWISSDRGLNRIIS